MENASKALLIAGAILIVIVLISIGMMIVSSSQDITGQVGDITTSQAITAFNQEYENYQGPQRGASVRSLLGKIATNNASNSSGHTIAVTISDTAKKITMNKETKTKEITQVAAEIVSSATYTVVIEDKDSNGYITEIKITR